MTSRSTDATSLEAAIERIRSLGLDALRAEWQTAFGAVPPQALTKDVVARMLAHRLQEQVAALELPRVSGHANQRAARPARSRSSADSQFRERAG